MNSLTRRAALALCLLAFAAFAAEPVRIIFDTAMGHDVDDARILTDHVLDAGLNGVDYPAVKLPRLCGAGRRAP